MANKTAPAGTKTTAQLRNAIDKGRTGDKIAWPDPAAVPLGVDEEAAGTPPSSAAVARAHREETGRPAQSREQDSSPLMMSLIIGLAVLVVVLLWLLAQ